MVVPSRRNSQDSGPQTRPLLQFSKVGDLITSVRCFEMPDGSKEDVTWKGGVESDAGKFVG